MAAQYNIGVFEEGNFSSHTQTTNTNTTPPFSRAIRKVVSFCKLRRIVVAFLLALWSTFPVDGEFLSVLEKFLTDRNRNSQKKLHPCESRCLRLKFSHEVSPVIYTGECIFSNGTKLELVDVVTGQQVRHVPLASAQVEIFLLSDGKNWTREELNNHIRMQKRDRKSGRDHNPYVRLEGGVVSVNEIKFKHTPKHMKKLKLVRLGARIVDQPEEIKVIEAVTGPFTVKDKRLKSKKRYPPSPTDDVWRLEHIYRNGAFHKQLTENGIKTVEDFLIELQNNPQRLRQILGKMPEYYWKKATMHAKTCNLEGRKYSYHHQEISDEKFRVVFNVDGQLDSGYSLHHFNMLSESQKGTTGRVDSAECSTYPYAIADQQSEPDEMSLVITSPGHSGCLSTWGYIESPNNMISESEDLEGIMQFLCSDQLDDFPYANNSSAAETSSAQFHEMQDGEMTQNQFRQFMVSENVTNANQQRQMNNILMAPEASTRCKGKCKKSWTKISCIMKCFLLKRFVKHKRIRMTKKRKSSSK